ncbi:MAG: ATP-binding cassette domain-containing protein [Alphaproteobacteria bacterium]|jgi:ATP-binding cassette subfamily F protein uup|nr:ATP-binding cassette domain-containing protein [Alphaproteobacteria bacterium]
MARPPLLTLSGIELGFGGKPLFEGVELAISKGERAALVGRNGAGKSTLMKLVAGMIDPDEGDVWMQPGSVVAFVAQEPDFSRHATLLDFTAQGIENVHRAEAELTEAGLDPGADPMTLSGGQQRRAAIARGFAHDPDILLMDEPTNHLDIHAIERLEGRLNGFRGAVLIVSHDRRFLERVSTNSLWLRQGKVLKSPTGYADFEDWAEKVEEEEAKALARLQTQLKDEKRWLARGVTARRKRNQGRLERLREMRREHAERRAALLGARAGADLSAAAGDSQSRKVIEARHVSKAFERDDETITICRDLTMLVLRGDRIGLVGPNGVGKTTLLRLLLGETQADEGRVKVSKAVRIAYLDQTRESLRPKDTLWETLAPNGGDTIMVQGRPRHVAGYAKQFLFDPNQLHQPVAALSGGERNRLTLAVALAEASDLLVLDEPTNDLDMQTLDMLEDMLANYEGTLLLVSHDRAFLDATVTSCLVPRGNGEWVQTAGGWSDAVEQVPGLGEAREKPAQKSVKTPKPARAKPSSPARKLSFKDAHRLKELDSQLPALRAKISELEAEISDPDAYARDPAEFNAKAEELDRLRDSLSAMEDEWLEIEERREMLEG